MANLNTVTSKEKQLEALRDIHQLASKCYRNLAKQKYHMTTLLRIFNSSQNRGFTLNISSTVTQRKNDDRGKLYYQQRPSLAKTPISGYNDNNSGIVQNRTVDTLSYLVTDYSIYITRHEIS